MTIQYVSRCELTGYYIEFIINNDIVYINTIWWDFNNHKAFLQLLRKSIEQLNNIKPRIVKIRQTVSKQDWDNIIKENSTFNIISENKILQFLDIECGIDDFLENFGRILEI